MSEERHLAFRASKEPMVYEEEADEAAHNVQGEAVVLGALDDGVREPVRCGPQTGGEIVEGLRLTSR